MPETIMPGIAAAAQAWWEWEEKEEQAKTLTLLFTSESTEFRTVLGEVVMCSVKPCGMNEG